MESELKKLKENSDELISTLKAFKEKFKALVKSGEKGNQNELISLFLYVTELDSLRKGIQHEMEVIKDLTDLLPRVMGE